MTKIVLVEWYDAQSGSSEWKEMKDVISLKPALGKTLGYLVGEGKVDKMHYIVVCPHIVGIGDKAVDGDGELAIPKAWVKKITVLLDDKDVKDEYLLSSKRR